MKPVHFAKTQTETLTVGEIRALLAPYPDDMPVMVTWESQELPLESDPSSGEARSHGYHG